MKKGIALLPLFLFYAATAQRLGKAEEKALQHKEDSLKKFAVQIIQGRNSNDRFDADSNFTKMLVRALKTPNSFYYPFDSLLTISHLYAPDSSFKIFTWQMVINDNVIRQHGAIQMKTYDGSLKLFPLIDKSDVTIKPNDTIGNNKGWIGAVYYNIVQKKNSNQDYYTLLGFDENNIRSNKKLIEVLHFDGDEPVFGGRFFSFEEDTVFKTSAGRYIMEYKKDDGPKLNYDAEMDVIVVEHLISETNEPNKKWTYVGDGDYEGFKWKNGKWVHIEKLFNQITPLGQMPVPNPIDANKLDNKIPAEPEDEKPAAKPKQTPVKRKGKG
jgi:hypothetical protein